MVEFGTSSTFRGWVRVRVLGCGSGVRGRKVKSRDCALASDLVRAIGKSRDCALASCLMLPDPHSKRGFKIAGRCARMRLVAAQRTFRKYTAGTRSFHILLQLFNLLCARSLLSHKEASKTMRAMGRRPSRRLVKK